MYMLHYSIQSAAAPSNDLRLYKALVRCKAVDSTLATAAMNTFGRHLWYLSEHLVAVALFDEDTPLDVLTEMVTTDHHIQRR